MKRGAAVLAAVLLGSIAMTSQKPQHPGSEPFTPTKQDWLLLEAGSCFLGADGNSMATVSAGDDPETVKVELFYNSRAAAREVNAIHEITRASIEAAARRHGWHQWVKVDRVDYPHNDTGKFGCPQS
jgi:hypothetical protein